MVARIPTLTFTEGLETRLYVMLPDVPHVRNCAVAWFMLVEPPGVYFSACAGIEIQRSVPYSLPSIAAFFFSLPIT